MKQSVAAALAGALFGVGLSVSGMTTPEKVQGFLDIFGAWDSSLLFVMVGAIGVHLPMYRLLQRRSRPILDTRFHVPSNRTLDVRLFIGAALFGIGWGLSGYCPGPAITSLSQGANSAIVCGSIVLGVFLHELLFGALASRQRSKELETTSSSSSPTENTATSRECEQRSRVPC